MTPAQQLMVVVPQQHQLEIEAWVEGANGVKAAVGWFSGVLAHDAPSS